MSQSSVAAGTATGSRHYFLMGVALMASAIVGPSWGAETPAYSWQDRLSGNHIVLLGEIHDNAVQQRLRFDLLKRAVAAGWRPAIAMEQFDRERQQDIDRARSERPLDADYLIAQASDRGAASGGWDWTYYRPYIALALEYRLPLLAANLSRADAEAIVNRGYAAVFDAAALRELGLDRVPPKLLSLQQAEVEEGHCHLLPEQLLPAMARAQLARDAVMARILDSHAQQGAVLLAGDGHARRDLGVARWLSPAEAARVFSVGFLERGSDGPPIEAFDAVVVTKAAKRPDPCATLRSSRH